MPQYHSSIKTIIFEAVFVVIILTVLGHMGVDFWDKYYIQAELTQVKTSLYSLKKTLANIGYAYDNLHKELTVLFDMQKNKSLTTLPRAVPTPLDAAKPKNRNIYTLDRRRLHDVQVKAALTLQKSKKNKNAETGKLKKHYKENVATQSRPENDAATITRNPLKATAVEVDLSHENCRHHYHHHAKDEKEAVSAYNHCYKWKF